MSMTPGHTQHELHALRVFCSVAELTWAAKACLWVCAPGAPLLELASTPTVVSRGLKVVASSRPRPSPIKGSAVSNDVLDRPRIEHCAKAPIMCERSQEPGDPSHQVLPVKLLAKECGKGPSVPCEGP